MQISRFRLRLGAPRCRRGRVWYRLVHHEDDRVSKLQNTSIIGPQTLRVVNLESRLVDKAGFSRWIVVVHLDRVEGLGYSADSGAGSCWCALKGSRVMEAWVLIAHGLGSGFGGEERLAWRFNPLKPCSPMSRTPASSGRKVCGI